MDINMESLYKTLYENQQQLTGELAKFAGMYQALIEGVIKGQLTTDELKKEYDIAQQKWNDFFKKQ